MLLTLPSGSLDLLQVQMLLDALPTPVLVKDAACCFVAANQAAQDLLGIPINQLQGTRGEGLLKADQLERSLGWDREALASLETTSHEDEVWNAQQQSNRWCHILRKPVQDTQGQPLYLFCVVLDHTQQRSQTQVDGGRDLLEMLTKDAPLPTVLDAFVRNYESSFPGMMCSVLLLDTDTNCLHHGAGPSLPAAYCQALDGVAIGQGVGSCGTAAYTGKEVLISDIDSDPLWKDFRALAAEHGLRACWSIPILTTKGKVLGTFANYYRSPRAPEVHELQTLRRGAHILGLVIEHQLTEQRLQAGQATLRESAMHTQAILDNMADGVVTYDASGTILSFNNAASSMFGYPAVAVIGSDISVLTPAARRAEYLPHRKKFVDFVSPEAQYLAMEFEAIRRDGSLFPMSLFISKISTAGRPVGIGILRDITQRRKNEEEIHRLAFYDPLTELPNRRLLMDRLKQATATSARKGSHAAVMFLDLDHFKQLNDTLGHDMGDILLQEVARRLKACVREVDSVARLGGDEFVILMEAMSGDAQEAAMQAESIAVKVLEALGKPYLLGEHSHTSTPSIGIVVFMAQEQSVEDLLKKADVAMYQAKSAGRNTVRFFDPVTQAAIDAQILLERDLRRGLDAQEFVLFYQPQVNGQGTTVGNEALVRWKHHSRGMVPPSQFIALAETTGLIMPLGQWVLEAACAQLVLWAASPETTRWTLSVNVSASQFAQSDFVKQVQLALEKTGANPNRLKLELTESMLVKDVEDIISKMQTIKNSGVGFSLDDFGTGYSSLTYLKHLPLDQLKIDQSFVHDVLTDPSDAVIARTIVALGHSLGLTVIAEGVETIAQAEFLAEIGCDAFQGYYYGRPAPAAAIPITAVPS